MAETTESPGTSIQPWQSFTAMFVSFWAVSAYFDHFLMTIVFCVAFGVLAEIFTKMVMEGEGLKQPGKLHLRDVASTEREMLRELEEERIKQELEILEIMKAEEELEIEKKLLLEKSLVEEKESYRHFSEVPAVPEEDENPPALPNKDFLNVDITESRSILSGSEEKYEEGEVEVEHEDKDEDEAPPPVPSRDFFDITVNDEDSFEADSMEVNTATEPFTGNVGSETFDPFQNQAQNEDPDQINNLISTAEESLIGLKCYEGDENEVNNKIVTMLETTMDMMDKRHFPDSMNLLSSPENEEKLIDFENDLSADEGINFENQNIEENNFEYDKTNESLDSPDSQNFSGESDLVAEETGRKELEASIIETKLDDGETLGDFLVMTDGVLNTDKNNLMTQSCQEARELTKGEETEATIDIDLTDPAVEAAATKIQSAFKGFKTRKKMSKT